MVDSLEGTVEVWLEVWSDRRSPEGSEVREGCVGFGTRDDDDEEMAS